MRVLEDKCGCVVWWLCMDVRILQRPYIFGEKHGKTDDSGHWVLFAMYVLADGC